MQEGKSPRHSLAQRLERSRKHRQWLGKDSASVGGGGSVGGGSLASTSSEPVRMPSSVSAESGSASTSNSGASHISTGDVDPRESLVVRRQRALQMGRKRSSNPPPSQGPGSWADATQPVQSPSRAGISNSYASGTPSPANPRLAVETGEEGTETHQKIYSRSHAMQPSSPCESMVYQTDAMASNDGNLPSEADPVLVKPGRAIRPAKSPKEAYQLKTVGGRVSTLSYSGNEQVRAAGLATSNLTRKSEEAGTSPRTMPGATVATPWEKKADLSSNGRFSNSPSKTERKWAPNAAVHQTPQRQQAQQPHGQWLPMQEMKSQASKKYTSPPMKFPIGNSSPRNAGQNANAVLDRATPPSKAHVYGATIETPESVSVASLRASFNSPGNQPLMPMNSKDPRVRQNFSGTSPSVAAQSPIPVQKNMRPSWSGMATTSGKATPPAGLLTSPTLSTQPSRYTSTPAKSWQERQNPLDRKAVPSTDASGSTARDERAPSNVVKMWRGKQGSPTDGRESSSVDERNGVNTPLQEEFGVKTRQGPQSYTLPENGGKLQVVERIEEQRQRSSVVKMWEYRQGGTPGKNSHSKSMDHVSTPDDEVAPVEARTVVVAPEEDSHSKQMVEESFQASQYSNRSRQLQKSYNKAPWQVDSSPPIAGTERGYKSSRGTKKDVPPRGPSGHRGTGTGQPEVAVQALGPVILPGTGGKKSVPSMFSKTKPKTDTLPHALLPVNPPVELANEASKTEEITKERVEATYGEQLEERHSSAGDRISPAGHRSGVADISSGIIVEEKKSSEDWASQKGNEATKDGTGGGDEASDAIFDSQDDHSTLLARMAAESSLIADYEEAMKHASKPMPSYDDEDSTTTGNYSGNPSALPEDLPAEFQRALAVSTIDEDSNYDGVEYLLEETDENNSAMRLVIKQSDSTSVYIEDDTGHTRGDSSASKEEVPVQALQVMPNQKPPVSPNKQYPDNRTAGTSPTKSIDSSKHPTLSPSMRDSEAYRKGYYGEASPLGKPRHSPKNSLADERVISSSPTHLNRISNGSERKEIPSYSGVRHDENSRSSRGLSSELLGSYPDELLEGTESMADAYFDGEFPDQSSIPSVGGEPSQHSQQQSSERVAQVLKFWASESASQEEHDEAINFNAADEWLDKDPDFDDFMDDDSAARENTGPDKLIRFSDPPVRDSMADDMKNFNKSMPVEASRYNSVEALHSNSQSPSKSHQRRKNKKEAVFDPFADEDALVLENPDDYFSQDPADPFMIEQSFSPLNWGNPSRSSDGNESPTNYLEI